ncbi:MAG: CopG family transcriptional regulator [Archaeoglobales archaeon]|nr:MAG: CopG family transcriptional regulator [Archaeoglobales archaeon]
MEYGEEYGEVREIRRISVALDPETFRMLREISNRKKQTISHIVRTAIRTQYESELWERHPEAEVYVDFLSGGENVILSLELWDAMLEELNEKASNEFWEIAEREGYKRGVYYKSIGLGNLQDILKHIQHKNWFKVKVDKNCYTLTLIASSARKLVTKFLGGLFKALNIDAEVIEFQRSLLIIEK